MSRVTMIFCWLKRTMINRTYSLEIKLLWWALLPHKSSMKMINNRLNQETLRTVLVVFMKSRTHWRIVIFFSSERKIMRMVELQANSSRSNPTLLNLSRSAKEFLMTNLPNCKFTHFKMLNLWVSSKEIWQPQIMAMLLQAITKRFIGTLSKY